MHFNNRTGNCGESTEGRGGKGEKKSKETNRDFCAYGRI
jgi:hypothetical protein